jgi:hypothetical protein
LYVELSYLQQDKYKENKGRITEYIAERKTPIEIHRFMGFTEDWFVQK